MVLTRVLFIEFVCDATSESECAESDTDTREMNQVFDANVLPPTEGKALMVRHLKQYFTGNSDSESEASRPSSSRKPSGMSEEIFQRLMALKQRLDDDDEIRISERTMRVLQDRQSRRESLRSLSSKSSDKDSPDPTEAPQPCVSQTGMKLNSPSLLKEARKTEVKKLQSPKRTSGEQPSQKIKAETISTHKINPSTKIGLENISNSSKDVNKIDTKCVGGRIFLASKPKFENRRTNGTQVIAKKIVASSDKSPPVLPAVNKPMDSNSKFVEEDLKTETMEIIEENGTKKSELTISFTSKKTQQQTYIDKKESFKKREPDAERTTIPSFLQKLRNYEVDPENNLEIDLVVNGIPKPRLTWYKDSKELKLNEYRQKWVGNKVTIILFPEYWTKEALLSVIAENQAGQAQNECIIYVDSKPYEVIHEIQHMESEAEIDSSDISEMVKELRMEQIQHDCDGESEYSEEYMPRELSPIFEVTEDEISHSLRSDNSDSSRRSSIRSIESIRSTLTMLTPTQSFLVTRTPTIEKLSVSVSSEELGCLSNGADIPDGDKTPTPDDDPLSKAESNYRTIAKHRTAEVSIVNDEFTKEPIIQSERRGSLQSIGTVTSTVVGVDDDDAFSIDSYATIEDNFDGIEGTYRSTKDLMSFVTKNYLAKTCYTTDTATDTETEITTPNTTCGFETVASPNNLDLFPTPTSTMFPNAASVASSKSPNEMEEKSRHEDLLLKQLEHKRQTRKRRDEPSTETESEFETYNQLQNHHRRQRKMTEEERMKKERQKTFQQKYRLTQRFIEDSIKGNATSIELNQKEFDRLHRYSPTEISNKIFSDSEVFLDTDDDGMDTISEITIDFGRTNREEFELTNSQLPINMQPQPIEHPINQNENYIDL